VDKIRILEVQAPWIASSLRETAEAAQFLWEAQKRKEQLIKSALTCRHIKLLRYRNEVRYAEVMNNT
jgi:hypothetical protein